MLWEFSSQFAEDMATPSKDTARSATVSGTPPKVLPTGLPLAEHEPTAPQVLPTVVMAAAGVVTVRVAALADCAGITTTPSIPNPIAASTQIPRDNRISLAYQLPFTGSTAFTLLSGSVYPSDTQHEEASSRAPVPPPDREDGTHLLAPVVVHLLDLQQAELHDGMKVWLV